MRQACHYNISMRAFWPTVLLMLTLAVGTVGCAHDTSWMFNADYEIVAVDIEAGTFTITGAIRSDFVRPPSEEQEQEEEPAEQFYQIKVLNSPLNDRTYTVVAVEEAGEELVITVTEAIPDATVGGVVQLIEPEGTQLDPKEVLLYFRTVGELDSDYWYYIVFNLSRAPELYNQVVPDDGIPFNQISGADRARNWEMYVLLHPTGQGDTEAYALQRPRLPTTIATARGPMDATTGYFTEGEILESGTTIPVSFELDIAVACRLDGKVQLIQGLQPDLDDPVYFVPAEDIAAGDGPGPIRLHAAEFTGDNFLDLLVLYEGAEAAGALRVLAGDGIGGFTAAGADVPVDGTPIDWHVADFNGDGRLDIAVLTTSEGAGQVGTWLWEAVEEPAEGEESFTLTAGEVLPSGDDPVAMSGGLLEGGTVDLVVANGGTVEEEDGQVRVFLGPGDGTFTAGPQEGISGQVLGVEVGEMLGTRDDIVVTYFAMAEIDDGVQEQRGFVSLLRNTEEEELAFDSTASGTMYFDGEPRHPLIHDTAQEPGSLTGVVVVDGRLLETPAALPNQTMYILRRDRDSSEFAWYKDERNRIEIINYLTSGAEPTRIHLANFNGDEVVNDFVIVNSADDDAGNRISIFHGLGRHNYTSADIYWTDDTPESLYAQEWYLRHTVGPNSIELVMDPDYIYDLAFLPVGSFTVDFMTGTRPIEYLGVVEEDGLVEDNLVPPVVVPIVVDHEDNDQYNPRADVFVTDPAADIVWWDVGVE